MAGLFIMLGGLLLLMGLNELSWVRRGRGSLGVGAIATVIGLLLLALGMAMASLVLNEAGLP